VRQVLRHLGPFPEPVRSAEILRPLLSRDKKATARGLAGILLEKIGRARVEEDVPETEWLAAAATASIEGIRQR
jgi:3-dehydroquinate synthetase